MRNTRVDWLLGALVLAVLLPAGSAMAYGEAGRWSSGWGQGTTEYAAVVDEHNQLYIACNDLRKVRMTATVNGTQYGGTDQPGFAIVIDGQRFDEPYDTESQVGESNFFLLWDKLRSAKAVGVVTADGQQLALPTQDAASVLPATQSADFECLTWDKDTTVSPASPASPASTRVQLPASTSIPKPAPAPETTSAILSPSTFEVSWRVEDFRVDTPVYKQLHVTADNKVLHVVSRSDRITVHQAAINRGNCRNTPIDKLPLTLDFGEETRFILGRNCNILELQLLTDQGVVTYQFDSQS